MNQISQVAYVSRNGMLCGSDRQKLFELSNQLEIENTLEVLMVNAETRKICRCTPRDLLPYAFNAKNLGLEREMRAEISISAEKGRPLL